MPPSEWVKLHAYSTELPRKDGEPITRLLLDEQHDLSSQSTFFRIVQRLENMDAVQNLSQWRLSFEPNAQSVQLHHVRVHRDGTQIEFAKEGAAHLLQREENLDSFILHGNVTLLILLEDIRVGDLLECSYTIHDQPQLLSNHYSRFCRPAGDFQTGRFHYSVRCLPGEKPSWRSHPEDWQPVIEKDGDSQRIAWTLENLDRDKLEPNTPADLLPERWLQLSTIKTWEEISKAASVSWPEPNSPDPLKAEAKRIQSLSDTTSEQIEAAIRFVQDEFRYLSVNLEVGGQIPAAPDVVLRRRYGDCKDLSLLLSSLLNELGVSARPVLVHYTLGKHLEYLLPSPALFDHVVVEFSDEGRLHWVDATMILQGGSIQGRLIADFHSGLPLVSDGAALTQQPKREASVDQLEVQDTLILDTADNPLVLRVQTTAHGQFADTFRNQHANEGAEGFAELMKQQQSARFDISKMLEQPKFEDDRTANLWRMVELYEVPSLPPAEGPKVIFKLPPSMVLSALQLPDSGARSKPFAIPNRLKIKHATEIRCKGATRKPPINRTHKQNGVEFQLEAKYRSNMRTFTTSVETSTDSIPAEAIKDYREMLAHVIKCYTFSFSLPAGVANTYREIDFFKLPQVGRPKVKEFRKLESSLIPLAPKGQTIRAHPKRLGREIDPIIKDEPEWINEMDEEDPQEPTSLLVLIGLALTFIAAFALALYVFTR